MSIENNIMEKIVSLAKRRGFIFPTAEKYGGLQGFWDWGPLGVELKNNIKKAWWKKFVQERKDMVGLDCAIITNPKVWEASGHVDKFSDFVAQCKKCNKPFKAEDLFPLSIQSKIIKKASELEKKLGNKFAEKGIQEMRDFLISLVPEQNKIKACPNCGSRDWTPCDQMYLMLKTFVGPSVNTGIQAYLRPETAQNIFVNFDNVLNSSRMKIPFGIAQIGKAFRNEITPGNFIFRSREFEQMEIEYFINPKEDKKWFDYWVKESKQWFLDLGIKKENIKEKKQGKDELAHYSKATTDLEYNWPFMEGYGELIGIANRTDYDLKAHGFKYKDEKEEFMPYVIEPSFGIERPALAFLLDAYEEIKGGRTTTTESNKEEEVILHLHKDLAPIKAAILPLSKKEPVSKLAIEVYDMLKPCFMCAYDEVASIGRRYRRQDEIGTPFCVTIDFDSLEDKKVTVRDRDTMKQERVAIEELKSYLEEKLK